MLGKRSIASSYSSILIEKMLEDDDIKPIKHHNASTSR
jgi:hypothetical protein